jgi:hypothetical protein
VDPDGVAPARGVGGTVTETLEPKGVRIWVRQ